MESKCKVCKFKLSTECLQCFGCDLWVDRKCIKFCDKQTFKFLQNEKTYACTDCSKKIREVLHKPQRDIDLKLDHITSKLSEIENSQKSFQSKIVGIIHAIIDEKFQDIVQGKIQRIVEEQVMVNIENKIEDIIDNLIKDKMENYVKTIREEIQVKYDSLQMRNVNLAENYDETPILIENGLHGYDEGNHIDNKIMDNIKLYHLRESKKRNVIMDNIPESNNTDPLLRKRDDLMKIKDLLSYTNDCPFSEDQILDCFRLNTADRQNGKPKLLKVIFKDQISRNSSLKNRKKLKTNNSWMKQAHIFPDLVKIDRELRKKLIKECDEKNRNSNMSNTKWIIRDLKIIQISI